MRGPAPVRRTNILSRLPVGQGDLEGKVSSFKFANCDLVFIGHGSLALEALDAVEAAGARAIVLQPRLQWHRLYPRERMPAHIEYETTDTHENEQLLLARKRMLSKEFGAGRTLRAFLAGIVPPNAHFCGPPVVRTLAVTQGVAGHVAGAAAIEDVATRRGFKATSLQAVYHPDHDGIATELPDALQIPDDAIVKALAALREREMKHHLEEKLLKSDATCRIHESGLLSRRVGWTDALVLRPQPGLMNFETAYFDEAMVASYLERGFKTFLLFGKILLPRFERTTAFCRERGLNLVHLRLEDFAG